MDKKRHLLLGSRGCGNAILEAAFALAGLPLASPTRSRLLEVNPLGQGTDPGIARWPYAEAFAIAQRTSATPGVADVIKRNFD